MITLTKATSDTTAVSISAELDRQLAPLSYDIERSDILTTYKISRWAPLRYSMFMPFSEVSLKHDADQWVLQASIEKWVIALPILFSALALLLFGVSGPLDWPSIAIILLLPSGVAALGTLNAYWMLRHWWRFV